MGAVRPPYVATTGFYRREVSLDWRSGDGSGGEVALSSAEIRLRGEIVRVIALMALSQSVNLLIYGVWFEFGGECGAEPHKLAWRCVNEPWIAMYLRIFFRRIDS